MEGERCKAERGGKMKKVGRENEKGEMEERREEERWA